MSQPDGLSVTLLGPYSDHKMSLEAMLAGRVSKLTWLPDSLSLRLGQPLTSRQRLQRALDQLTYTHDKSYLDNTCRHLQENSTNVVVAYWGTMPLADICAVKRRMPHIKIVLMLLCFPLALDNVGLKRQFWLIRHAAKSLDGIIYSNQSMQAYLHNKVLKERAAKIQELVLKPCWPRSYQSSVQANGKCLDHPNLIFAGRTDLSSHTIQHQPTTSNPLWQRFWKMGLKHHVRSSETDDNHPFRRTFEPLDQGALISKMATHDASLIAYNAEACQRTERLELTVPDRLLTSVAAGVPIAIPSTGYTGSKQYLADYPAVFQYDSVPNLKRQLADRKRVQAMHIDAWQARERYTAEAQGGELAQFLAVVGNT